jgi:hypothetical protein
VSFVFVCAYCLAGRVSSDRVYCTPECGRQASMVDGWSRGRVQARAIRRAKAFRALRDDGSVT